MKNLVFLIFFLFSLQAMSQNEGLTTGSFIRVYDSNVDKIGKGKISSLTSKYLLLTNEHTSKNIAISDISVIKTEHSKGHLPLIMGTSGFAIGAGVAVITYDEDAIVLGRGVEMIGTGLLLGIVSGCIGLGIGVSKKYRVYEVNGDPALLKEIIKNIDNEAGIVIEEKLKKF